MRPSRQGQGPGELRHLPGGILVGEQAMMDEQGQVWLMEAGGRWWRLSEEDAEGVAVLLERAMMRLTGREEN